VVDDFGRIELDLQTVLDSTLEWHVPGFLLSSGLRCRKGIQRYYVVVDEIAADGTTSDTLTLDNGGEYFTCLKGGISYEQWKKGSYFDDYMVVGGITKFLSWQNSDSTALRYDQPMWLNLLKTLDWSSRDMYAKWVLVYTDGSSATATSIMPYLNTPNVGELYCFKVGACQNGWDQLHPSKQIDYIEFGLYDDVTGDPMTEIRRYTLSYANQCRNRYFVYNNSLGGPDTLCLGYGEENGIELDDVRSGVWVKTDYSNGAVVPMQTQVHHIGERLKRKGNTGSMSKFDINLLRQMLLAEMIYEIVPGGLLRDEVRLIGINRSSQKVFLYKNTVESVDPVFELEYEYAFNNKSYTPETADCCLERMPSGVSVPPAAKDFINVDGSPIDGCPNPSYSMAVYAYDGNGWVIPTNTTLIIGYAYNQQELCDIWNAYGPNQQYGFMMPDPSDGCMLLLVKSSVAYNGFVPVQQGATGPGDGGGGA
jgi:hypothetical protein